VEVPFAQRLSLSGASRVQIASRALSSVDLRLARSTKRPADLPIFRAMVVHSGQAVTVSEQRRQAGASGEVVYG
jgi:hypothetical protein